MRPVLEVKVETINLRSRTCTCCDEKAYIEITAGAENGNSKQTQSMVLCQEHAKILKIKLPG